MKISRSTRRVRSAVIDSANNTIEMLEQRQLLSATLTTSIPAQSLAATQSATTLSLSSYFDDSAVTAGDTVVNIETNLPSPDQSIPLELTDAATPITVANFLKYISTGEYANTIVHRSVPGFIIQGGGYTTNGNAITSFGSIEGESSTATLKNTAGTIAMALTGTAQDPAPNSGSDNWYINLATNSGLDDASDGGPFTAFGQTLYSGLATANAIAALPTVNDSTNGAWTNLPVQHYTGTSGVTVASVPNADFVILNPVVVPGGLTYTVSSTVAGVVSANVSSGTLSLTPVGSGTTNVTVTATDLGGGTATSTFAVTVTGGVPSLSIANGSGTAGSSTDVVFPVTLSGTTTSPVTLDYSLTAGSAPASDFTATGSTLTVPAGSTTADIPVTLVKNSTGGAETFTITLSSVSGATFANGGTTETATGTIDPVAGSLVATTVTLQTTSSAVGVGGTDTFVATVTPKITGTAPTGTVTFSIAGTSIGSAAVSGGTATLTTILSTAGNQSVIASYSGSSTYAANTSSAVLVNVSTLAPVVVRSTLPGTVIKGVVSHGKLLVTATNASAVRLKGTATFSIFASTDGLIDSNSVQVATLKRGVNLLDGKSASATLSLDAMLATLPVGTYTLLAQTVDPLGNTSDSATGPTVVVSTPVITLSESFVKLVIPANVVAGSKTPAAALIRITNSGNIKSSGTTTIALYASTDGTVAAGGTPFKTITPKVSIPPNDKSVVVRVPLTAYPDVTNGDYFIVVQVTDPTGGTSSADFATPVNIATAKIDLANTLVPPPATGKIGKTIPVTLELVNNGNITATGNPEITFSTSISSTGSNPTPLETFTRHISLKPNQTQALHLRISLPLGTPTGDLYLVSVVDPTGVFSDVDLSNNTSVSSTFIAIGVGPVLGVVVG